MTTCNCVGDWCTCSGHKVAKDGATVHIGLMMKDSAMTETPTKDTMPTASMTLDEALKLPRYQGMQPGNARQYATRDLALAGGGLDRLAAHRDHHAEQMSDAWKAPAAVNDNNPRSSTSAEAHDRMSRDMSDAWKA